MRDVAASRDLEVSTKCQKALYLPLSEVVDCVLSIAINGANFLWDA